MNVRYKEAYARAEKGLRWLQEVGPHHNLDWRAILLDRLQLDHGCYCALGQASARGFYDALVDLADNGVIPRSRTRGQVGLAERAWAAEHGFYEPFDYTHLQAAWEDLLRNEHQALTVAALLES